MILLLGGTGTLPEINIVANNADSVGISIPASTTIVSTDSGWDGMMVAPKEVAVTIPEVVGETRTVETAIEIGVTDVGLSFDKAVRILFPNQQEIELVTLEVEYLLQKLQQYVWVILVLLGGR